jgi:hypothetical protein
MEPHRRIHPHAPCACGATKEGAVTAEPTHTIKQSRVQNLLGKAAGACGGALNSFLVVLGDKCGLYATGQYSFDVEEPIPSSEAPRVAQKRSSSFAAERAAHAHGSATPSEDRAMSVQRGETALMTLICHDCAAATDARMGNSVKSVRQL